MKIDNQLLDTLSAQAKANPRLRQSYDLRTTPNDNSQRMLNAIEPGTIMPIHRHRNTSETMVMVRGKLIERFYDDNGNITDEFVMEPQSNLLNLSNNSKPSVSVVQIEAGQWHSLEVLEEGTIIFEAKDGAYAPLQPSEFLNVSLSGTPKVLTTPSWQLYQQLCDTVFGSGAVTIKPTTRDNNIIGTLKYTREFADFRKNFQTRLERLRDKFKASSYYSELLATVMQVADPSNWEGAYAELVAYDVLHNGYHGSDFQLNVTLGGDKSYASDLGGKQTNEDGYLPDYGIYFDVKSLADTTGNILKELIQEAINKAGLAHECDVLPEYPLDDDEADYADNRRVLMEELRDYLKANEPTDGKGKDTLRSQNLPHLTYRILWGGGINSTTGEYGPYEHAENTKHLMLKRYSKKFMKDSPSLIVLVNFPWYNNRINSFINADELYYRALSRRTFCGYKHSSDAMVDINPKYIGSESPHEVSQHLSGIIFIDDHSIFTDTYSCHTYLNPNAVNPITIGYSYLHEVVRLADNRSVIDDFRGDNY